MEEANEYAYKHGIAGFTAVSSNLSLAVPTGPFYPGLVSADERWHMETEIPLFGWSVGARGFFTGRYGPELRAGEMEDEFARRMVEVYCTEEPMALQLRGSDREALWSSGRSGPTHMCLICR